MESVMQARRAKIKILYNGRDVSRYVINFSYTDNYDQTDDISITLSDREKRWADEWFPETGDTITASIEVFDWNINGDNREIELGTFEVDNYTYSDIITINAVAVPITSSARSEKKNRAWVDIPLSGIAGDISSTAGLALVYDTDVDPHYDNADQNDKSDLYFLGELCKSDGLCMKVTDGQLIIYEESKYEQQPEVATIIKGTNDIIGFPRFSRNAKDIYKAATVSYFCPKTNELYQGKFTAPMASVGHTLKLREDYNGESDDMSLGRKAKARLREKNKYEFTCDITLKGDIIYFSGTNVVYDGWGNFDGKYHIHRATHALSNGGYTVSLNTRRCLVGY